MEFLPFSFVIFYYIGALGVLLFFSFMVSGAETALLSFSVSQIAALNEHSTPSSSAIKSLLSNPNKLLSTILIFNNFVNIGAILTANIIVDHLVIFNSGLLEFVTKTCVVTFVLLICGEIMPKILATYHSAGFAGRVARPLLFLRWFLSPLSWILIKAGVRITGALTPSYESVSLEQLHSAIEITSNNTPEDRKILSSIVNFVGREVVEIMRARVDVVALEAELDYLEVLESIKNSIHSRLPVYGESLDDIQGILFIKDLLPYLDRQRDFKWQDLLRPPYFIPENKKINDLLEDFQSKHQHLAIVVDEYGGTLGLVTLEDILEEIVGEIADESDRESDFYRQISASTYIFDGSTHLSDFARVTGLTEDVIDRSKGEADTLAGLMMELREEFFNLGDEVQFEGWTLRAEDVEGYRITKVFVRSQQ